MKKNWRLKTSGTRKKTRPSQHAHQENQLDEGKAFRLKLKGLPNILQPEKGDLSNPLKNNARMSGMHFAILISSPCWQKIMIKENAMRPIGARASRRIWYYQKHNASKDVNTELGEEQNPVARNEEEVETTELAAV